MKCLFCKKKTTNPKFCNRSCSAKYNNKNRNHTETTKLKIKNALKSYYEYNNSHHKGRPGRDQTESQRLNLSKKLKEYWDRVGRVSDNHRRALGRACTRRYYAKLRGQLPSDADLKLIDMIYEMRPPGYEVDHIIPISKGGLHHQDNLQYLPSLENKIKNAKLEYQTDKAIDWRTIIQMDNSESK